MLSPDGRWLVYASRYHAETGLRLRDLATGEERWLLYPVQLDVQGAQHASWDLMPGSSFTPDSKSLITTIGGKLWRVSIPSGETAPIPFTVDVEQPLGPAVRFERRVDEGPVRARRISAPSISPDGERVAFSALGRIWVMDLPNGTPRRLTDEDDPFSIRCVGRPPVERSVARQTLALFVGTNADAVQMPPLHILPGCVDDGVAIR